MKKKRSVGFDTHDEEIKRVTVIDSDDGSDVNDEILPSSFKEQKSKKPKNKKAGMKKKLIIMLIAVAAAAVVFGIVFFAVIKPAYEEKKKKEERSEPPLPLIEGEVRDSTDGYSVLLYDIVDKAHTKRITVSSTDPVLGFEFSLVRNDDGDFYVKEHGQFTPVTVVTTLDAVSAAGHTVIEQRIEENCTDLSVYGLAPEDHPRKVTIESTDGVSYSYYIGKQIPSKGGYYCREDGRNAVYIMDATGLSPVMGASVNLIQPILGPALDTTSAMMMEQFVISKNGQIFVSISYVESDLDNVRESSYKMEHPASYTVNDNNFGTEVLTKLGALEGYMVVAAGDGTAEGRLYNNTALMAQFGFYDLDNPSYELYYELGDVAGYIMFTESGSDAYYYAYSMIYDTIVLIEKTEVSFIEWDLREFVSDRIFYEDIKNVSSLSVSGKISTAQAEYTVDEKFTYVFDENEVLHCKAQSTGLTFSGNTTEENYIQGFYLSTLYLSIGGYISEKGSFSTEGAEEYARFTIEYTDATKREYIFYRTSGYCYFKVDGVMGEFYVDLKEINALLVNAARAANNCYVDERKEYPSMPDIFLPKVQ